MTPNKLVLIAAWFLAAAPGYADGFPIKDGRYAGGPVVKIKLTTGQSDLIRQNADGVLIQLTTSQQRELRSQAKLRTAPTKLEVHRAADFVHTCTCFAANVGFPFKTGWIEVPVTYLCSDEEAAQRKPDPNG